MSSIAAVASNGDGVSASSRVLAAAPGLHAAGDDTLKVGLIGCGWYGKCDLLRLIQVEPVEVVAMCDVDSKMLSESNREKLFDRIADWCDAWAVGAASQEECDRLGMAEAQRLAARRAIDGLGVRPDAAVACASAAASQSASHS